MARRRTFTDEFKREAVALAESSSQTMRQVAADLGIHESLLQKWRRQLRREGSNAFPGVGNARDEEVALLKRELLQVKRERDFLRDAAAFFAKESR
jgi:transposase